MSSKAGGRAPVSLCGNRVMDGCFESCEVKRVMDGCFESCEVKSFFDGCFESCLKAFLIVCV